MLTYATIFSGIGGWELGLNACGWKLQWQCECDPFCRALLKERFGVPVYEDVRSLVTPPEMPTPIDVLVGSPPCQPFSRAGQQNGVADERHLYPAFIRAVGVLKPRWVLMEQVPAVLTNDAGRAFGEYVGGLAALGYDLAWHCIPARTLNAPIERDRVWIVAFADTQHGQARLGDQQDRTGALPYGNPAERISFWLQAAGQFVGVGDGFSDQLYSHRVGAIGNAVAPQIPQIIGQAINEIERGMR